MGQEKPPDSGDLQYRFPTTMWTAFLNAREKESHQSLELLFNAYWRPIYSVIRLKWNQPHEAAKDSTQAFFLALMESGFAERIERSKGRLRSYLKASLKYFMVNRQEAAGAQKRGGHIKFASIEELPLPPPSPDMDPETLFDRMWAHNLLARAIDAAERGMGKRDRSFWIEALRLHDLNPSEESAPTYKEIAAQLGKNTAEVKKGLEAARRVLREAILDEIRQYAGSAAEVRDELNELFASVEGNA